MTEYGQLTAGDRAGQIIHPNAFKSVSKGQKMKLKFINAATAVSYLMLVGATMAPIRAETQVTPEELKASSAPVPTAVLETLPSPANPLPTMALMGLLAFGGVFAWRSADKSAQ
jgi:hypothetical protein